MENLTVNILGTEYRIETRKVSEDKFLKENHFGGYCAEDEYLIVVADLTESEYFSNITDSETEVYRKKILRHELFHAFLSDPVYKAVRYNQSARGAKTKKWLIGLQFNLQRFLKYSKNLI